MKVLLPRTRSAAWFGVLLLTAGLAGRGLAEAPGRTKTPGNASNAPGTGNDSGVGGVGRWQIPRPGLQQVFQLSTRLAPTAAG